MHDFPRPTLAVDTALLTVDTDRRQLLVVEMEREESGKGSARHLRPRTRDSGRRRRALPAQQTRRAGRQAGAVDGVRRPRPRRPRLGGFGGACCRRATRAVTAPGIGAAHATRLVPVDRPGELVWDHPDIVRRAKEHIRSRYAAQPDPYRLLGPRFALSELQRVHEAVAGLQFPGTPSAARWNPTSSEPATCRTPAVGAGRPSCSGADPRAPDVAALTGTPHPRSRAAGRVPAVSPPRFEPLAAQAGGVAHGRHGVEDDPGCRDGQQCGSGLNTLS